MLVVDDYKKENVIRKPLLSHTVIVQQKADTISPLRSFIRHDSQKLALALKGFFR